MAQPKRPSHFKRFASTVLLGSLVMTGILVSVRQLRGFENAELQAYDRFIQLRPQPEPDTRILIVGIDEDDIQGRQEYPIEDGTIAELLSKLESYQPRAIGLDVARDIPQGPEAGRKQLTNVLQQSDRIVSACLLSSVNQPGVSPAPGAAPAMTGFAGFPQDSSGIVRRTSLVSVPEQYARDFGEPHICKAASSEIELPSLGFLLSLIYLEAEGIQPEPNDLGEIQLNLTSLTPLQPNAGSYIRGDILDYQLMLNYRAPRNAFQQVSLSDVLNGKVNQRQVRDKVVLIGYTSQVEKDVLLTPYTEIESGAREMPGVVVHGQVVSQLLSAVLDGRPLLESWSDPGEILWIWLWALTGGSLAFYCQRPLLLALLSGGTIASCWGLSWFLFQRGLWVPLVPTAWGILITALGILLLQQARQGGYTQAIYEQLQDQLRGQRRSSRFAQENSFGYLEDLVRRAQQVRQGESTLVDKTTHAAQHSAAHPELDLAFEDTEQQDLYEQIRAQVEAELQVEQASQTFARNQQQQAEQEERIQALLNRAQALRSPPSSNPESSIQPTAPVYPDSPIQSTSPINPPPLSNPPPSSTETSFPALVYPSSPLKLPQASE